MSPGNNNPAVPPAAAMNAASTALKPPEQTLKCPRCDSSNTKFCYYNNYSLTQPRHFCKTCRRYWTKGGALRNVPIGGGCRKSKKSNKSGSSSRLSSSDSKDYSSDYSSSSEISGALNLKYFQNLPNPPAMDFQLGSGVSSLSRTPYSAAYNGGVSCFGADQIGGLVANYPLAAAAAAPSSTIGFINPGSSTSAALTTAHRSDIASSIESLSCINQDLHWKLQQQRYAAMAFGGGERRTVQTDSSSSAAVQEIQEVSRAEAVYSGFESYRRGGGGENGSGGAAAPTQHEWFFDGNINSFTPAAASAAAPPLHNGDAADSGHVSAATGSWNGVQWWSDLHQQYGGLP